MMGSRREMMGVVFALLAFFLPIVTAQGTTSNITAASTFYFDRTETQFSVNIADDSDDVFIYFASPAYSWVGVGFGPKMQGSLMFIMYPNSKGNNVTVSPRIGSSGAEPTFNSSIDLSILPGTTVNDSMLILKVRCGNCRDYMDTEAESQPMIYAFGNGDNLMSNSPSANLARHFGYGSFTMNLRAANGPGGVPAKSNARNGVEMQGEMTRDHDRANLAHAIMGCLALFILWPLNLIAVAVFKNIKIHVMFSAIILVFLIVSFVLGGVVSGQYNRSKAFNTPHQIFALVAILPLLLMSLLPALNHINARLRSLHTPLASTSFALLVLTGGLGLHLSSQTRSIILVYTALSLGIFMFLILMHTCIHRRGSAHARALNRGSNDDAIMLAKMDDCRSIPSAAGFGNQPPPPYPPPYGSAEVAGAQHQRNGSRSMYGGGTMPGPHYMLNMHPGVPVQVSRM